MDNFYISPQLFEDLYELGLYASGTCRSNRKQFPHVLLDNSVKSKGQSAFYYHGPLTAGKWRDKRDVYFMSSLHRGETDTLSRRSSDGSIETLEKPKIVCDYNKNMSGVDIADQLMVYYACGRRTLKWYKRVFWRLIEKLLINSYILFKLVNKPNLREWHQKKYRMTVAYGLVAPLLANRIGQGRSPSDTTLSRLKGKHFAYIHSTRKR